jgi:hypothetical protein
MDLTEYKEQQRLEAKLEPALASLARGIKTNRPAARAHKKTGRFRKAAR